MHHTIAQRFLPVPNRHSTLRPLSPSNGHLHISCPITIMNPSESIVVLCAAISCANKCPLLAGPIPHQVCLQRVCQEKSLASLLKCRSPVTTVPSRLGLLLLAFSIPSMMKAKRSLTMQFPIWVSCCICQVAHGESRGVPLGHQM